MKDETDSIDSLASATAIDEFCPMGTTHHMEVWASKMLRDVTAGIICATYADFWHVLRPAIYIYRKNMNWLHKMVNSKKLNEMVYFF